MNHGGDRSGLPPKSMFPARWRAISRLPRNPDRVLALRRSGTTAALDLAALSTTFVRWTPFNAELLGSPAWRHFMPPVRQLGVRRDATRRANRLYLIGAIGWLGISLFDLLASVSSGRVSFLAIALLLLSALFFQERKLLSSHRYPLFERALYFDYLRNNARVRVGTAVLLLIGLGVFGLQRMLEAHIGGLEQLALVAGMDAESMLREPYRLVVGPLIHANATHVLGNLALLACVAPVVVNLRSTAYLVLVFVAASAIGGMLQLKFGIAGYRYYFGVSAGIFALILLAYGQALRTPRCLPVGFDLTLLSVAAVSLLAAEALTPTSATIAHLTGALIGLGAGWLAPPAAVRHAVATGRA